MKEEPRGRGRPALLPHERKVTRYCKLAPSFDERLCCLSNQTGISINALIVTAVAEFLKDADRIIGLQKNP